LTATELSPLIVEEGIASDAAAALKLAERSGGSLARARELADPTLWQLRDRFAAAWLPGQFDPTPLIREFDDYVAAGGKEADSRRQRLRQLILVVADVLRATLRKGVAADDGLDGVLTALDRTLEAEQQLDRNANQATLLECWLDDLAAIPAT
jgi:DNA polymerase-3 subunit delta'